MAHAIGIDLGTTFSAVAIVEDSHGARVIPNAEGQLTTPSVALWYNGTFLVGQQALDVLMQAQGTEYERLSTGLIRGVKRMIGKPPVGGLFSNGRRTDPIEVSAAILYKLSRDASLHLSIPIRDAVITVPAHFVDQERSATRKAAEMAGLRVLQILNEPSAAALTYTHGQQAQPGTALVFDLGGGTFDATILRLGEHEGRVLATRGIEELGGINFTNSLAKFLQKRYEQLSGIPYPSETAASNRLVAVAEGAKCRLSDTETTSVRLVPPQGPAVDITVTRQEFERQIDLLLVQLESAVEQALERANLPPAAIDRVLLCGGSSRIPAVQKMLERFFDRRPETTLNLDLSVALGAAYQAACYREDPMTHAPALQLLAEEGLVVDCVSYHVGIAVKDQRGETIKLVLLKPGDPLEKWSNAHPVRILGAGATFPPIDVYTGDGTRLLAKDYLGSISLALPSGTPSGARATVQMRQDRNGLVQVQINVNGRDLPGDLQRV